MLGRLQALSAFFLFFFLLLKLVPFYLLVTCGVCIFWILAKPIGLGITGDSASEQELRCLYLTRRFASLSDFGHHFIAC